MLEVSLTLYAVNNCCHGVIMTTIVGGSYALNDEFANLCAIDVKASRKSH